MHAWPSVAAQPACLYATLPALNALLCSLPGQAPSLSSPGVSCLQPPLPEAAPGRPVVQPAGRKPHFACRQLFAAAPLPRYLSAALQEWVQYVIA